MDAEGVSLQFKAVAADRSDATVGFQLLNLCKHFLTAVYGTFFGSGEQSTVVVVTAIGKGFKDDVYAKHLGFFAMGFGLWCGLEHKGQGQVGFGNGFHNGTANMAVGHHVVVECAMGFDVGYGYAEVLCHAGKCGDLVLDYGDDFNSGQFH